MTGRDPYPGGPLAPESEESFLEAVRRLSRPVDWAALLAVPGVLVAVFLLPDAVKQGLVLSHGDPRPAAALTAHYVHLSTDHLVGNLSVYALVVPVAYLLCLFAGHRRTFFLAFTTYLLALPPVLSALDLVLLDGGVLLGFSGVLMAFVGFLPLAVVWYADRVAGLALDVDDAPGLFFMGLAGISLWSVPVGPAQVLLAAVAGATGLAYAVSARSAIDDATVEWPGPGAYLELGGAGLVAFTFGIAVGFPPMRVADGVVVDQYGHLLGYAIGFIAAYATVRVDAAFR